MSVANEQTHYFEITAESINAHAAEVRGTIQDVTNRVMAEQTNKKLQDQLLEAQKLETIGTLARGVAHDFNNLLTPVIGYAEILSSDFEDDDPKKQYSDQIQKSGLRAKGLVEQLLTFSREQDANHQTINISEVCEESIGAIKPLVHSTITYENLVVAPVSIAGDPNQLHQVLLNLCQNADSATHGIGTISISLETTMLDESNKPYALIKVKDDGPGIEADVRQHMFEPFYTTQEVGEGPGLGLSMVHGIINRHHGVIEVESQKGETVFNLFLPIV